MQCFTERDKPPFIVSDSFIFRSRKYQQFISSSRPEPYRTTSPQGLSGKALEFLLGQQSPART